MKEQQVQGKKENEHMDVKITSLDHAPARAKRPSPTLRRVSFAPYLFILPFGVLFLLFFIVPIIYAIYQSLYRSERSGLGLGAATVSFNGLGNYGDVFHDPNFYAGVGRVLLYGIVQVPVMLGLALLFALLLDSTVVRFKAFFRLAFFVPYAIPGIIAALQAIPGEIYESARIDGCSGWRVAWHIKIPLVAPALVLTGIFSIIGTLQLFNEPQVLSAISNNINSSYTPNFYAYYTAFGNNNYYYAAALSVVLALVTFVFSFGFLRVTQRQAGV